MEEICWGFLGNFWGIFRVPFFPSFWPAIACFTVLFRPRGWFGLCFWPNLWRTFHHPRVHVLAGHGRVSGVLRRPRELEDKSQQLVVGGIWVVASAEC